MNNNSLDLVARGKKVLSPALGHYHELEVISGKGSYLLGADGKKYLDFATGIAVNSTGHCHPKVVAAAVKQAKTLIHACAGIVYYEPNIKLAEMLQAIVPLDNGLTFFLQSGGEANEAALKLARYVTKKPGIIAFQGAFHGRTFGALSITTSKEIYRQGYEPLLPEIYFAPYPKNADDDTSAAVEKLINEVGKDKIAAMIIEPVLGEGGYIVPPVKFIQNLRKLCDENGILLIFDEVQTGFGRTGKMFAAEHFGVKPDIMTVAKGIASGFPLSAVIAKESVMNQWPPGAHGNTFTGNPVSCAAGIATVQLIQDKQLLRNVTIRGKELKKGLIVLANQYKMIGDVRGLGLMIGVEIVKADGTPDADMTKKIMAEALKSGLILISCGINDNVIRFVPPLNVKKAEVQAALSILGEVLARV